MEVAKKAGAAVADVPTAIELSTVEVDLEAPLLRREQPPVQQSRRTVPQRAHGCVVTGTVPVRSAGAAFQEEPQSCVGELRQRITGPIDGNLAGANLHGVRSAAAEHAALKAGVPLEDVGGEQFLVRVAEQAALAADAATHDALEVARAIAAERQYERDEGMAVPPHPGNRFDGGAPEPPAALPQPPHPYEAGSYKVTDYVSVYESGQGEYAAGEYKPAEYTCAEYRSVYD